MYHVTVGDLCEAKCLGTTVESRFLEPPRETQTGSRNREVQEIEGKYVVFD